MNNRIVISCLFLSLAGVSEAATLITERFDGDTEFTTRCGGSDNFGCEWAVAEGRAGNRANNGTWERGFFDRINNTATTQNAGAGADFTVANAFSLSYDGAGGSSLTYLGGTVTLSGVDFATSYGGDNPTAPARSLYVRVRDADLSSLSLISGSSSHIVPGGPLLGIGSTTAQYLVIGGFDVTASWTLSGFATLGSSNNSGSAFQVKVTDLPPSPVPLPAAAWLLVSGIGGLAGLSRLRRKAG